MKVYGTSNIGLVRKENQDAFIVGENEYCTYAVVCDGMGGANGGSVASQLAADIVSKRLLSADKEADLKFVLISAIAAANVSVFEKSKSDEALEGMGTTIVAAVVRGETLHIAHAGDSRAYLFDGNGFNQLTRDHSVVQELLESGEISADEAQNYPNKNLITRALGVGPVLDSDYAEYYLPDNYSVFICTDGVTNLVDDKELSGFMNKPIKEAVDEIIDLAVKRGGTDNATAVMIGKNSTED